MAYNTSLEDELQMSRWDTTQVSKPGSQYWQYVEGKSIPLVLHKRIFFLIFAITSPVPRPTQLGIGYNLFADCLMLSRLDSLWVWLS
jgi:hypothetical protein